MLVLMIVSDELT